MSERDRRPSARSEETFRTPHLAVPSRSALSGAHDPSPNELDAAIDRAVRDMMNVDADDAFRARVMARLGRAERQPLHPVRMLLAGAAAGLVLALMLTRTTSISEQPAVEGTGSSQPSRLMPAAEPQDRSGSQARLASRRPGELPRREAFRVPANVTQVVPAGALVATLADDQPADSMDGLERIEPIRVDPLRPNAIGAPPIVIAPLTPISKLDIAPLTPRIERE